MNDKDKSEKLIEEMISIRKQQKITQTELAQKINIKQQTISRIENKENIPSLELFCRIIDALGYKLEIVKTKKLEG